MLHWLSNGIDRHSTSKFHVAQVEFKCILFVPGDATGLYEDYNNRKAGMKLYVRKVLIQEDFEDLLPR